MPIFNSVPPYYEPVEPNLEEVQAYIKLRQEVEEARLLLDKEVLGVQQELREFIRLFCIDAKALEEVNKAPRERSALQNLVHVLTARSNKTNQLLYPQQVFDDIESVVREGVSSDSLLPYLPSLKVTTEKIAPFILDFDEKTNQLQAITNPQNKAQTSLTGALSDALTTIKADAERLKNPVRSLCGELLAMLKHPPKYAPQGHIGHINLDEKAKGYSLEKTSDGLRLFEVIKNIFNEHKNNQEKAKSEDFLIQILAPIEAAKNATNRVPGYYPTPTAPDLYASSPQDHIWHTPTAPDLYPNLEQPTNEQVAFHKKKEEILAVITEYIAHNSDHCRFSFFHRHGKEGRERAAALRDVIEGESDNTAMLKAVDDFINGSKGGNTNPHSLRTMLHRKRYLHDDTSLKIASKDLEEKIADDLRRGCSH